MAAGEPLQLPVGRRLSGRTRPAPPGVRPWARHAPGSWPFFLGIQVLLMQQERSAAAQRRASGRGSWVVRTMVSAPAVPGQHAPPARGAGDDCGRSAICRSCPRPAPGRWRRARRGRRPPRARPASTAVTGAQVTEVSLRPASSVTAGWPLPASIQRTVRPPSRTPLRATPPGTSSFSTSSTASGTSHPRPPRPQPAAPAVVTAARDRARRGGGGSCGARRGWLRRWSSARL